VQISRQSIQWIVGVAVVLPVVMLVAAPAVALFTHERGVLPERAHVRMLAEQVENAWHDATPKPLRYVGGVGGDLADGVLTYAYSQPERLPDVPEWRSSRIAEYGMAFVCFAEDTRCITDSNTIASHTSASRRIETRIVRDFLGIAGKPYDYVIVIVPPGSPF
jgi:hypothetical protein